jgi:hypothetical protein
MNCWTSGNSALDLMKWIMDDTYRKANETTGNPPETNDTFPENGGSETEREFSEEVKHNVSGTRGRPFGKGQSGNPAGKPKGARNRGSVLVEELLDGEAEAIGRKLIELALSSDRTALRLAVERLLPPRRERAVPIPMPQVRTAEDARQASDMILARVTAGELTLAEGNQLVNLLDTHVRVLEAAELERRLQSLEEWAAQMNAESKR